MSDSAGASRAKYVEFKRGWQVLLAAALGSSVATTAIPLYSMGVFIAPLEQARGWSRTDITTAATIFSFCLPISILILGHFIERCGVRRIVVSGHVMLGLVFLGLAYAGSSLYAFWGFHALAALLAAGASPVAYTRGVIRHFHRARGLAIGIFMASAGVGAALAPPLLDAIIDGGGWQAGYQALAATLFVIGAVVFILLSGEDNLAMANAQVPAVTREQSAESSQPAAGRRPIPRSLWWICLVIFLVALSVNGYVVHFVPLLRGEGLGASEAAIVASYIGLAVIIGRLATGALLDRVSTGLLGCFVFAFAAVGILMLQGFGASAAPLAAFLLGFTVGAEVDLVTFLVSRMFPAAEFSRYFSWVYSAFMIGGGLSPLMAGQIFDRTGQYQFFFTVTSTMLLGISAAFMVLHWIQAKQPERLLR